MTGRTEQAAEPEWMRCEHHWVYTSQPDSYPACRGCTEPCEGCPDRRREAEAVPQRDDDNDWTRDENGRSNSSQLYLDAVSLVAGILDRSAFDYMQGPRGRFAIARTVVSNLAHTRGFRPGRVPVADPTTGEAT